MVRDSGTGELIGDVLSDGFELLVAKGGQGGLGNTRFKSSTNRAPTKTIPGRPGEERGLLLELRLLADVGLLGLPNAGKSTLLRTVSRAHPKVADYPFTTMYPQLGVIRIDEGSSFVMADIPGLIEGASQGAGLGTQFLRHLSRTSLLLHIIDIMPPEGPQSIVPNARVVINELHQFDKALLDRPRWLVLNKTDLVPDDELQKIRQQIVDALDWQSELFMISAATGQGCPELMQAIMKWLLRQREELDN
jgi:GTP-binding protein